MNPRQKVHTLLLISELLLYFSMLVLSIIGCVKNPNSKEKIWNCSKILTLKQILEDNKNNTFPIINIISEDYFIINEYYSYSYLLEHSTKDNCEVKFKKCGILDSIGNIMCIPESDPCPINEIKLNSNESSKNGVYYDYFLYYTNKSINNNIVTNITINKERPKYITYNNFIFDVETYRENKRKSSSGNSDGDYGYDSYDYGYDSGYDSGDSGGYDSGGDFDVGGGFGGWRNLEENEEEDNYYGDQKINDYILKKLEEKSNIDIYYKNISDNLYIRNYIGFGNLEQMNKFMNFDFRENYKMIFPNLAAIVFGYISSIPFIILIVFAIKRLCYKDKPNQTSNSGAVCCTQSMVIFLYIIFFLGFFIYFICTYIKINKYDIDCQFLKTIETELFINDFIEYFCSISKFRNILILVEICLFSLSFILFVLGWIVHFIVQHAINKRNDLWNKNNDIKAKI